MSSDRTLSQSLRAVAITGRLVLASNCRAKANPRPREAGVTMAKPDAIRVFCFVLSCKMSMAGYRLKVIDATGDRIPTVARTICLMTSFIL